MYRFFPSRDALLLAVLADFEEVQTGKIRERQRLVRGVRDLDALVRAFGEAACDALDEAGAGGWVPLTRAGEPTASLVCAMAVATSRAALSRYAIGAASRERALDAVSRGVRALLDEFRR